MAEAQGEGLWCEQDARATIKVPTHRATPPPPLRVSGLAKRADKKSTLERIGGCGGVGRQLEPEYTGDVPTSSKIL
ncbi:MAG: hypothetical protein M3Y76_03955 [Chloroflexota bacterium]|nr:hypothetical protein [Chloroflexota bacterium]